MEIEDKLHARRLNAAGHRQGVFQVAIALGRIALLCPWVVENSQANGVEAAILQQLENILGGAPIGKTDALLFLFMDPRDIGAEEKTGWRLGRRAGGEEAKQQ